MSNIKKEFSAMGVAGAPQVKGFQAPLGKKMVKREFATFEEMVMDAFLRDEQLGEVVRKRGDSWVLFDDETDAEIVVFKNREDAWKRQRQKRKATSLKKKSKREGRKRKKLEKGVFKAKSAAERNLQKKKKKHKKFYEAVQDVRKVLNESMIAYVFQNPPSSEDAHIWDNFISKLSRDVVLSDKGLGGILKSVADVEAETLGKAAHHVVKGLGPKFPTTVRGINRDEQGEILVDLQSQLPESKKTVDFSIKLENSKPVVFFSSEAKQQLNSDLSPESKLLRAEVIHIQETQLGCMEEVTKKLEERNAYLKSMKDKCSGMFEKLSPLEVEVFRNILKKESRKKRPVSKPEVASFSRHELETDEEIGTGTTEPADDTKFAAPKDQEWKKVK